MELAWGLSDRCWRQCSVKSKSTDKALFEAYAHASYRPRDKAPTRAQTWKNGGTVVGSGCERFSRAHTISGFLVREIQPLASWEPIQQQWRTSAGGVRGHKHDVGGPNAGWQVNECKSTLKNTNVGGLLTVKNTV